MTFWKRQNYKDRKCTNSSRAGETDHKEAEGTFGDNGTVLYLACGGCYTNVFVKT